MSRPYDWAPLAEVDPLPGDPDAILGEAFRLRSMAAGITDQVGRLRGIGAEESLTGQAVGELRASALSVAKKLELVAERYSKVSGFLNSWARELEDFQAATVKTLNKALEAEAERRRNPHADLLNPNLFIYQTVPASGLGAAPVLDGAEALLAQARTELRHLLDEAAARDRYWSHRIGQAIDDDLTDGFFDHIHQWVERNNHWIEQLTDKLGWVTTAAALGALLIPGVGEWVAVAEVVETVGQVSAGVTFAAHAVQVAGGEKDARFDLGLDIFALGSLTAAKGLTSRLGRTAEETREAAAEAAGRTAAQDVRFSAQEQLDRIMADPTSTEVERGVARDRLDAAGSRAARAANDERARVLELPEADAGIGHVLLAGDAEAADATADIEAMRAQFGDDATVGRLADKGHRLAVAGRANFLVATGIDAADKTGGHTPFKGSYGGFKHWVVTGGPLR